MQIWPSANTAKPRNKHDHALYTLPVSRVPRTVHFVSLSYVRPPPPRTTGPRLKTSRFKSEPICNFDFLKRSESLFSQTGKIPTYADYFDVTAAACHDRRSAEYRNYRLRNALTCYGHRIVQYLGADVLDYYVDEGYYVKRQEYRVDYQPLRDLVEFALKRRKRSLISSDIVRRTRGIGTRAQPIPARRSVSPPPRTRTSP